MSADIDPAALLRDLATNPTLYGALLADQELGVDDFVDRHVLSIRQHFASAGYRLDFESGYSLAARVWRFLHDEGTA